MATRVMKKLVEKGFVKKHKNPKNRRKYVISLTKKGKAMKPIVIEKLKQ